MSDGKKQEQVAMTYAQATVYANHRQVEALVADIKGLEQAAVEAESKVDRADAKMIARIMRGQVAALRQANELILQHDKSTVVEAGELPHDASQPIEVPGTVLPGGKP